MLRIFTLLLSLLLFVKVSDAQTTYTWIGGAVGDYQDGSNWSPGRTTPASNDILAFNTAFPITVANVPGQTIGAIQIASGTNAVTFTTNIVTNKLFLSAATPLIFTTPGSILVGDLLTMWLTNTAIFSISSGTFGIAPSTGGKIAIANDIILNGGTLDFDVAGTGGTTIVAGGSITNTSGTFNCVHASAIIWDASDYFHNVSGASSTSIPAAIWAAGSTCNITGMNGGTIAPAGFTNITFNNLIWNCTSQSGNVDLDFSGIPVNISGAFTVASTGASALRFSGASDITVNAGSYNQTNGKLVLQGGASNSILYINGNFSHTAAGTIDFVGAGASGTSTLSVKGNITKGSGTTWSSTSNSATAKMTIQFSGSAPQLVSIDGTLTDPAGGTSNITNSNSDPSGVVISGSVSLRVRYGSGGLSATCSNGGNFSASSTRNIVYSGSNTTLVYNGTMAQTASGIEFPVSSGPLNLTINSSVVNFPSSTFNRTVAGTLTMTKGSLNINLGNTLLLSNSSLASQLSYTAGYINSGTLSRTFPASGLPTTGGTNSTLYPFGSGANNRSVNLYFSASSITTGGDVAISHTAAINATSLSTFSDNGVIIDKRSNSRWDINTGTLSLGSTTISLTAEADNIGSVDNLPGLVLINSSLAGFGTIIPTTGINEAPVVGKSGLTTADINAKTFYVGSDNTNALQIVTFTWTGLTNTSWNNAGNWTGGLGYPSAPTEIAIINSGPNMPVIGSGLAINLYQLAVASTASLTLTGTGSIAIYDAVTFSGSAIFASTSTFTYASSVNDQTILNLPYGILGITGTAAKIFPATTTVTGDFIVSGTAPDFITNSGNFVYDAGTAAVQRIAATNYYNLTFQGNRGGRAIRLGNGVSVNTIKVSGNFVVNATNYTANYDAFNTFDFSSASSQTIPGFTYGSITNTGGGPRVFDNLGSADPAHVVSCKSLSSSMGSNTTSGSKIRFNRNGTLSSKFFGFQYYDWEITGDLGGTDIYVATGQKVSIAGTFFITATNFKQPSSTNTFAFNGTGPQTIPAFKTDVATNTPAWRFYNINITNPNVITLGVGGGTDSIHITGAITLSSPSTTFNVAGSCVDFINGSYDIPVLPPAVAGGNNYHNVAINGGIRILTGDLKLGGSLSVNGVDSSYATLTIGNNASNRTLTIAGNLSITGTTATSSLVSIVDLNPVNKRVDVKLAGDLSISGNSQLLSGNDPQHSKGFLWFNGTNQKYTNTAAFKNKFINYNIGDGTSATVLTLNSNLELTHSGLLPFSDTLTVANNATLNVGTKNIKIGIDTLAGPNNARFSLGAGATLITANTGAGDLAQFAIEGSATDGTTGTIFSGSTINKNYDVAANYVLNGATTNPVPVAINTMNNLTIGAAVSLNRPIDVNGTLNLTSFTLTQASNNLEFSGLTSSSSTGRIYADKNSSLTIKGTNGTVDTLRFALPGGNTTGQFNIDRGITIPLNSDLNIEKAPLTGNFITGSSASILDINGNTLSINGTVSGPGFLAGSNISNLTLGGNAGTVNFLPGKQVLKNLTLVNNATAALGTSLDITDGTGPGTEGTVSVTGSALLMTGGNLALKSSANGTARIASGSSLGGYISGDVSVERYLSSIRSWRFLSAPSYGQTIHQAWQENQPSGVNLGGVYGTNITSNASTWAADGFDFQTPGNSLLIYNPATNAWDGAHNTSAALSAAGANKSYMLFLRGDRSVTPAVGAPSTSAVIRSKGTVFQGDQPPVPVTAGQFAAVGNNYASAIDFLLINTVNIDQSFVVWDPHIPGAKNLGAWVTFSAANGWKPVPFGGSYLNVANTRIESGQAFMVHSNGSNGTVTVNESSKLGGSKMVSRPPSGSNTVKQMFTTNLYNTAGGVANITDGNVVVFSKDYSNAIDSWDALKINNFGDNFGLSKEGQILIVDARQPVAETDTIFFNMKKVKQQSYKLEFIADNFDNSLMGFLEDTYLHNTTALNMGGTTEYDFTVTSDAGSAAISRFRIVFKNSAPLPVTFSVVSATEKNNGINVDWKIESEINVAGYDAEKSIDGRNFTKMYHTPATGQSTDGTAVYNWLDLKPITGDNFYRIRSISKDGKTEYSKIVKVAIAKVKSGFAVFPNPVTDGLIGLQINNVPAGIYTVRVINSNGQVLSKEVINHMGGNATKTIAAASMMISGSYQLEITSTDNETNILRIVVL